MRQRSLRRRDPFDVSHLVAEAAERAVIAGALLNLDRDPGAARDIVASVPRDAFHGDLTAPLFAVLADVVAGSGEPSRADVVAALHRGSVEGRDAIVALVADVVTQWAGLEVKAATLAREAVAEVLEVDARRRAVHAAEMVALSGGNAGDAGALLTALEASRVAASPSTRPMTLADAIERWAAHESSPSVPTGQTWFDSPTDGGFPLGGITLIVSRPNVGKSALALQLAVGAMLLDPTLRVVWGLGDMTAEQMAERTACVAAASMSGLHRVSMFESRHRLERAHAANAAIAKAVGDRFHLVGVPLTVEAIERRVVQQSARLVVVDYLQKIRTPGESDRVGELERIITSFRDMAINRHCAVVVISSIARSAGANAEIGALAKGSAEVDYAADLVYLGDRAEGSDEVTWHCKKARNTERKDIALLFDGAFQTYSPVAVPEFPEFTGCPFKDGRL